MAYLRSIFLMKNKKLFDMDSIDIVKYSQSLGLVVAPRIRFMQKTQQAQMKKKQESAAPFSSEEESDDDDDADGDLSGLALVQRELGATVVTEYDNG